MKINIEWDMVTTWDGYWPRVHKKETFYVEPVIHFPIEDIKEKKDKNIDVGTSFTKRFKPEGQGDVEDIWLGFVRINRIGISKYGYEQIYFIPILVEEVPKENWEIYNINKKDGWYSRTKKLKIKDNNQKNIDQYF